MDEDCVFCHMLLGLTPRPHRYREHLDTQTASFEPLDPVTPGHLLVIPTEHVRDASTESSVAASVMRQASRLARELRPCNIITSIGSEATQTIFHFHVHVVPRRTGDGLKLPWSDRE